MIRAIEVEIVEPRRRAVEIEIATVLVGLVPDVRSVNGTNSRLMSAACSSANAVSVSGVASSVKPSRPTLRIRSVVFEDICIWMITGGFAGISVRSAGTR